MKLSEFVNIDEASYEGNIGMMEMFKFYQLADQNTKYLMKKLISQGKNKEAWELLQKVVGVKLKDVT
jgi:hypothetical protein